MSAGKEIERLDQDREELILQARMLEASLEPIFIRDLDGVLVEWNRGCELLYGFTRAEAVGRIVQDLLRTVQPVPLGEVEARLAEQGRVVRDVRHTTKDGRELTVESREQVVAIGGRRLVIETDRDVTDRKRADDRIQESEARFRDLADSAPVAIWLGGADGGCEFANKASLDLFGKMFEEIRGFGFADLLHPDDRERYVGTYLEGFRARAPFRCKARFLNARGECRWLDSIGTPRVSASGDLLGYAGASLDVTDSERFERSTRLINEIDRELSRMIGPDEIVRMTTYKLGEWLGVGRCHMSEIDWEANLSVVRPEWEGWLDGVSSLAGEYAFADFITPSLRVTLEEGVTAVASDVTIDPRTRERAPRYEAIGIRSFLSVPVADETRWEATLTVTDARAREWHTDEVQVVRDVARRTWLAVKRARAVEALRESEVRARSTMAAQMLAGVAESDANGRFTMVNRRFCEIVGRSRDELLGMQASDVTHPDDWPENAKLYRRFFETGESFFIEKRYRRADGSDVWCYVHISPVRDAAGRLEASVAVVVDVTDRKRIEHDLAAAKDRLAADLDGMTKLQRIGAIFVREGDLPAVLGEIVEAAVAITAADKGDIQLLDAATGRLTIVAQHGFEQPFLDFWGAVEDGRGACGSTLESKARVIVEDVAASPIFVGTPALEVMERAGVRAVQATPILSRSGQLLAVFSTHFAKPHRPDERELRLLDLLAREAASIMERADAEATLRSAYEQAEAATRAKDEFLAVVSHELRSPLNSILGYARLLRRTEAGIDERSKEMVEIIERNGVAQLRLIEDLLDTGRIITGKLKLEVRPTDLVSVVAAALDVVRPSAEAKGIDLRDELDPGAGQITGDPERLQQVVWNLLSNAIKFTPKGGRVVVTLERDDPHVRIVVNDNGKGIDPAFRPHLFERFRQSDMSSARRVGGLGLGLPLVKHLVELHGGTVRAESAGAGQGATFTVRLPMRAVYTAPREDRGSAPGIAQPPESKSLSRLQVLIVDDEDDVRALLTRTLESYGAEARAVASAKEALELLSRSTPEGPFDVLLCDIGMPNEDGYTLVRRLRASPPDRGGSLPAVALTAYGRAEDRMRALEAGFQMHVVKPVDPDELAVVILSVVRGLRGRGRA